MVDIAFKLTRINLAVIGELRPKVTKAGKRVKSKETFDFFVKLQAKSLD